MLPSLVTAVDKASGNAVSPLATTRRRESAAGVFPRNWGGREARAGGRARPLGLAIAPPAPGGARRRAERVITQR